MVPTYDGQFDFNSPSGSQKKFTVLSYGYINYKFAIVMILSPLDLLEEVQLCHFSVLLEPPD